MKDLLIIKPGNTYPEISSKMGDFDEWIVKSMNLDMERVDVINIHNGQQLPKDISYRGVIITGSHTMVTEKFTWIDELENWIREVVKKEIPLLGICFGHQLIAKSFGGIVEFHPLGIQIGSVNINLTPEAKSDPLLGFLPQSFSAYIAHTQTVISLPENAVRLANGNNVANYAFSIGQNCWGLQFHPEFSDVIIKSYIYMYKDYLLKKGFNIRLLEKGIKEMSFSVKILKQFKKIIFESSNTKFKDDQKNLDFLSLNDKKVSFSFVTM